MTVGQKVLRFFGTRVVRLVILTASVLIAMGIIRSVITIWQKRGIVAERKAVLEAEERKHTLLQEKLVEATSAAFVERVARDKLGLVKEGEQVVILDKSKLQDVKGRPSETSEMPSWKQWWRLFF